jgi:hypothetical protein
MTVSGFGDELRASHPDARVEAHGRLAVIAAGGVVSLDALSRRRVVALARAHGFSNVALELTPDANLPGDQPTR